MNVLQTSRPPATHSAQTRHDAGVREIIGSCFGRRGTAQRLQIVTKGKLLDQTLQEGVPTMLRTHSADWNVFSPRWCPTYTMMSGCVAIWSATPTRMLTSELHLYDDAEETATVITRNAWVLDETECSTLEVYASTVGRPTQEPGAGRRGELMDTHAIHFTGTPHEHHNRRTSYTQQQQAGALS